MSQAKEIKALRLALAAAQSSRTWSAQALNCGATVSELARRERCNALAVAFTLDARMYEAAADEYVATRERNERGVVAARDELARVERQRAGLLAQGLCASSYETQATLSRGGEA